MSTLHHNAADKGVPMTLGELRQFVDRALGFEDDAELFDLDGHPVDRLTLADKAEAPAFDPNAGTEQPWYQAVAGARAWGFTPGLPGTSVHESVEAGLRRQHGLTHVDGTTCPTCTAFDARTAPTAYRAGDAKFDAPCTMCVKERRATGNVRYRCTDCRAAAGEDVHSDTPVTPQERGSYNPGASNDDLDGKALDAVRASLDAETGTAPYELFLRAFPGMASALNKALDRLVKAGTITFGVNGYAVVQ